MWAPLCPSKKEKLTLNERSDVMVEKLLQSNVGQRPIVWITHSMGGLIVKNILCKGNYYTSDMFSSDRFLFEVAGYQETNFFIVPRKVVRTFKENVSLSPAREKKLKLSLLKKPKFIYGFTNYHSIC